jgi:hypothetical protein
VLDYSPPDLPVSRGNDVIDGSHTGPARSFE